MNRMAPMVAPLFAPMTLGTVTVRNRIAMAPLTCHRSTIDDIPTEPNVAYYRQRAGAGLIVTEGTYPSEQGKAYLFIPGLCNEAQLRRWRRVTDAVHGAGGVISVKIMHAGRLSDPLILPG
jgi:N-ethylmaleimide reductase